MADKKIEDIKFETNDFELSTRSTKKDEKFDTEPTTFLKDAFKRFRKNKSSVAASIIILILMLGSFVIPVLSPYDTENHAYQTLLVPKLFNSGTGFWDGTKDISGIVYDMKSEKLLSSHTELGIIDGSLNISKIGENYTNQATIGAYGGSLTLANDLNSTDNVFFRNYYDFDFSVSDNLEMTIDFNDDDIDYLGEQAEFKITMTYIYSGTTYTTVLKDYTETKEEVYNLSNVINDLGRESVNDAKIEFQLKGQKDINTYIAFETLMFTTTNVESKDYFLNLSIDDANSFCLIEANADGSYPADYWQGTAKENVYKANIHYATFKYDFYEAAFGLQESVVDYMLIEEYVENGWCEYDPAVGPSSFVLIDEENCPIREVISQKDIPLFGENLFELTTINLKYIEYGYSSMPRYIFGTDGYGTDIFTSCFSGLKYSLILAVLVSVVCFTIGIVWGSISGYFGGTVDLLMERFLDILGNIPYLVVMTLALIILGNNFVTFTIALCLTGWLGVAGRTRVQFYRFKGREYVLASRTLGAKDKTLIFKHILPNAMGTIITMSILMVPSVISSETTLAYLGLGMDNTSTLGIIMATNQDYISTYPALILFPAAILSLIMISFNLFGNGLRDALNPTLKGSE